MTVEANQSKESNALATLKVAPDARQNAAAGSHADDEPKPGETGPRFRVAVLSSEEADQIARTVDEVLLERAERDGLDFRSSEFFDQAEVVEGILPSSAREALAEMRRGLVDAVVVRGLPRDEHAIASVEDRSEGPVAPGRSHAFLSAVVRRLGHEHSYAREKSGALVHDIRPTASGAKLQSNESWKVDLSLHTENAFHPLRPDYVCLCCVRAPESPPATHLSLLRDILPRLTDNEISVLREERFRISVVDSFLTGGEQKAELPLRILNGGSRRPFVRWHQTVRGTDEEAKSVASTFDTVATDAANPVRLRSGDLVAFANDRVLHGRDKFDAALDGSDRWLLRSYVTKDLAPLAPYVTPARPGSIRLELTGFAAD
jgi:L-asparagine oxygenase